MAKNKHTIFYAEDDLDDLDFVMQAFKAYDTTIEVNHAENGFEAIKILNNLTEANTIPCLIILDMNMPGMDGRETLIRIKQSSLLNEIPVVVFTTSSSRLDQDFAKKWGADFITKPVKYSELEDLAKVFVERCTHEIAKRA